MKALAFAILIGGALAWGDPLCLLAGWHFGRPLILGNDCVSGFVPSAYSENIEI